MILNNDDKQGSSLKAAIKTKYCIINDRGVARILVRGGGTPDKISMA